MVYSGNKRDVCEIARGLFNLSSLLINGKKSQMIIFSLCFDFASLSQGEMLKIVCFKNFASEAAHYGAIYS